MPVDVQQRNPTKTSNPSCHFLPHHHPSTGHQHGKKANKAEKRKQKEPCKIIWVRGLTHLYVRPFSMLPIVFWGKSALRPCIVLLPACQQLATHLGIYAMHTLCSSNLFGRHVHANTQTCIRYVWTCLPATYNGWTTFLDYHIPSTSRPCTCLWSCRYCVITHITHILHMRKGFYLVM